MNLVQVALPTPLRQVFTYRYDGPVLAAGVRVRVPFGQRELVGWVLGAATEAPEQGQLKGIVAVLDEQPLVSNALWQLMRWAANYYQHPVGDALTQMFPVLIRQGAAALAVVEVWRLTRHGEVLAASDLARSTRQQVAWQALQAHIPQGLSWPALRAMGISRDALQALAKKQLAAPSEQLLHQGGAWPADCLASPALPLNDEQAQACEHVLSAGPGFRVWLLYGITGSGKTEVYLQLIANVLAAGKQVLVLVPEIALTPQTVSRFRARFAIPIAVLHSGLTDNARLQAWQQARMGAAGIVIGTRSAVFTPMAALGLIVIDEEHDASFKQHEGFRYHGRDVAVRRAQLEGVPIVLGSATPSLESLGQVQQQRYGLLRLRQRAANAQAPRVRCVDLREQILQAGLAPVTLKAIASTLARGEQVLVFLNRRGYAPVLICHSCGWQAQCARCDAKPTLHRDPMRLSCHHCGSEQRPPSHCPECGSSDLRPVGVGTERLAEQLTQHFSHVPVYRIDRDSTRRKGLLEDTLQALHQPHPAILVGTQMLAKGHHLPEVTLVVVPDCDGGLFSADFRAPERLLQLLVQVSGRAGRASKPGEVILQTHQPEHPLLVQLLTQGYSASAQTLLSERRLLDMPPYAHLALVRAESTQAALPAEVLQAAAEQLRAWKVESALAVDVWGPMPAALTRKAGMTRWLLLVKSPQRRDLHSLVQRLIAWMSSQPTARALRWSVDMDPQDVI